MTTPDKEVKPTDMSSSLAVTVRDALEPFADELNDYPVDMDGSTRIWDCQIRVRDLRNAAAAYAALSTLPVNDRHHSASSAEIPRNSETDRQTSDDAGRLREALVNLCDEIDRHIDAAPDDRKPVFKGIVAARAALKGSA